MIERLLQYTFVIFIFSLPLSGAASLALLGLLLLLWIFEKRFQEKLAIIKEEKIILIFLAIAFLTLAAAFFSHSYTHGFLATEHKSLFKVILTHYLFVPFIVIIMVTSIKKETLKLAISGFLIAIFMSEITSYLIFFKVIDLHFFISHHILYKYATSLNPTPFMQHIEYSVYLSIACLLLLHELLHVKKRWLRIVIGAFLLSATANLFINGGRTGQIIYLLSIPTYILTYFRVNLKTLVATVPLLILVILTAYHLSPTFKAKSQNAIESIKQMQQKDYNSSWGMRAASTRVVLGYLTSTSGRFIFGAGAGDSRSEYLKYAKKHFGANIYKPVSELAHTHNQYLQYWLDSGILPLLLFLLFFYLMLKLPLPKQSKPLLYAFMVAVAFASTTDLPLFRYRPAMLIMFMIGYFISLSHIYKEELE